MFAATALRDDGRSLSRHIQDVLPFRKWLNFIVLYSESARVETGSYSARNFSDYLDGYFNSFDFYPTCTRHVFQRNDAFALWQDFLLVAGDLATSADRLQANPENYLNLEGWTKENVKARKEQIAREIQSRIAAKESIK